MKKKDLVRTDYRVIDGKGWAAMLAFPLTFEQPSTLFYSVEIQHFWIW